MIIGTFIAILCLLGMSAFFSGSETALTAASRTRMHQLERDGDKRAAKVTTLISNREKLIGAILLGNNLVNILASALATTLFASLMPGAAGVARGGPAPPAKRYARHAGVPRTRRPSRSPSP